MNRRRPLCVEELAAGLELAANCDRLRPSTAKAHPADRPEMPELVKRLLHRPTLRVARRRSAGIAAAGRSGARAG